MDKVAVNIKGKIWKPFERITNIRREAPEFRRCCFCLPLRRGLITWGYVKLSLNVVAIGCLIFFMTLLGVLVWAIVEIVFLITDISFNIVLIVGGHRKNVKLLKIVYIYSIVWLCLAILSFCWLTYMDIVLAHQLMAYSSNYLRILSYIMPGLCVQFGTIFVQIYLILLIRSEMLKLQVQTLEMQYSNPLAADALCTMHKSATDKGTDEAETPAVASTSDYGQV